MTPDQRRVAETLVAGPRKGVVGPFVPLLYAPNLLQLVEPLGAELRFRGALDRRVHELVVCLIAAVTTNTFEWDVHSKAALELGVREDQIATLRQGLVPSDLDVDEATALDFAAQLLASNNVEDDVFAAAVRLFGSSGVVELTTVVGYFVMVCWLINVAQPTVRWR